MRKHQRLTAVRVLASARDLFFLTHLKSHSRAVRSSLLVTAQRLSALIAAAQTLCSWPRGTTGFAAGSLALKSHSRAVYVANLLTPQKYALSQLDSLLPV